MPDLCPRWPTHFPHDYWLSQKRVFTRLRRLKHRLSLPAATGVSEGVQSFSKRTSAQAGDSNSRKWWLRAIFRLRPIPLAPSATSVTHTSPPTFSGPTAPKTVVPYGTPNFRGPGLQLSVSIRSPFCERPPVHCQRLHHRTGERNCFSAVRTIYRR